MELRRTPQTILALRNLLESPLEWRHGYDLSRSSGLKSGTLYPLLMRLTEHLLLESRWEVPESGGRPRHMYRLTLKGKHFARECVMEERKIRIQDPVFGV
jgi:PadR family transcriptional regulator, regulatory protein PadR